MPSVGEQLIAARQKQDLTIQQVADITKLRTDHVRALESGHYDAFSAPVYIRGFLRSYGNLLKLDTIRLLEDLDQELKQGGRFAEPLEQAQAPKGMVDLLSLIFSRVNWRLLAPVGVVMAVVLAGLWTVDIWKDYRDRDPLADLPAGYYQPQDNQAGAILALPQETD